LKYSAHTVQPTNSSSVSEAGQLILCGKNSRFSFWNAHKAQNYTLYEEFGPSRKIWEFVFYCTWTAVMERRRSVINDNSPIASFDD